MFGKRKQNARAHWAAASREAGLAIEDTLRALPGDAGKVGLNLGHTLSEKAHLLSERAAITAPLVAARAQETAHEALEAAQTALGVAQTALAPTVAVATRSAHHLLETAGDAAREKTQAAAELARLRALDTAAHAREWATTFQDHATDVAERARHWRENTQTTTEEVAEAVQDEVEEAQNTVQEWQNSDGTARETTHHSLLSRLWGSRDSVGDAAQQLEDAAHEQVDEVVDQLEAQVEPADDALPDRKTLKRLAKLARKAGSEDAQAAVHESLMAAKHATKLEAIAEKKLRKAEKAAQKLRQGSEAFHIKAEEEKHHAAEAGAAALAKLRDEFHDQVESRLLPETLSEGIGMQKRSNTLLWLAVGAAIGALLIYLFAPRTGRRHRAQLKDSLSKAGHDASEAVKHAGETVKSNVQSASEVVTAQVSEVTGKAGDVASDAGDALSQTASALATDSEAGAPATDTEAVAEDHSASAGDDKTPKDEGDDRTVTDRVRTELGENPTTSHLPHLNIDTVHGLVTVRGPMVDEETRSAIEAVVRQVAGVRDVQTQLLVEGTDDEATFTG